MSPESVRYKARIPTGRPETRATPRKLGKLDRMDWNDVHKHYEVDESGFTLYMPPVDEV